MRRTSILFFSSFQLAAAGVRLAGFSIHDDFLAHPQYEVILSHDYISEKEALALIDPNDPAKYPAYSASFPTHGDLAASIQSAQDAPPLYPDSPQPPEPSLSTYELMNLSSSARYLCAIPAAAPPEPSPSQSLETSELARAEEARELERASVHGWELLSHMEDQCLYFMAGWWSYSFCRGKEVVQYHALPRLPNAAQPPQPDPNMAAFILGRLLGSSSDADGKTDEWDEESGRGTDSGGGGVEQPDQAQESKLVQSKLVQSKLVQSKGDQRYLQQRLGSGTICDLTGRERTIEIQYHCVLGLKGDRIAWIKEVTTCTYLMVVNAPRLCEEAAFLPPQHTAANPITCRPIAAPGHPHVAPEGQHTLLLPTLNIEEVNGEQTHAQEAVEGKTTSRGAKIARSSPWEGINVGGVIIGAQRILGRSEDGSIKKHRSKLPNLLEYEKRWIQMKDHAHQATPRHTTVDDQQTDGHEQTAGSEEGQQHPRDDDDYDPHDPLKLSAEELEVLGFTMGSIDSLRKQLIELIGENGWTIETVEAADGGTEFRVTVEGEEEDDTPKEYGEDTQGAQQDGSGAKDRTGSEERFF